MRHSLISPAEAVLRIAGQPEIHGDTSGPLDEGVERVRVRRCHFPAGEDLVGPVQVDDLVPRSHECDPRRIVHHRRAVSDGGKHPQLRRAERCAGLEHDGALSNVLAPVADVLPGVAAAHYGHVPGRSRLRVFLAHHGVGAGRQWGTREDPRDLARTDRLLGELAGGHGLDHREGDFAALDVRRARRVAVHGGIVPRGQVDGTRHILGEQGWRG